MNKMLLALKILLPILLVLLAALLTLQIKCMDLHNDHENGLLFIVGLLLNIIPMIAMVVLGFLIGVDSILLLIVKNKVSVIISALIFLCLLLPFVGFSVYVDIATLSMFIEVPIIAVAVFAVNVAAMILCCIMINKNRKRKKELS